jgi:flagellar export protein FliJ
VKKFHFRLARVLEWRRQQLELEESRLAPLFAERDAFITSLAEIGRDEEQTRRGIADAGASDAQELAAGGDWLQHLQSRRKKVQAAIEECQGRVKAQQAAILEARRKVRLIERLEQRHLSEWGAAVDREQEALAAELFLARFRH